MSTQYRKDISVLNDHELLEELVVLNRKRQTMNTILSLLSFTLIIVIIIGMVIVIPRFMQALEEISVLTEQASAFSEKASLSLAELEKIDFDTLNQGITDFARIVSGLSNLFGR